MSFAGTRRTGTIVVSGLAVALAALAAWALLAGGAHAATPEAGAQAPEFSLPDQSGAPHALKDYYGKWVVLYFYPKDGTPGCTTEACEFRDDIFAFRELGAVILGVSVDPESSHKEFAEKHHLPFTLLADSATKVTRLYGLESNFFGMKLARRDTFIVDPTGRIARHYANVTAAGHSRAVLADLKALVAAKKN